MELDIDKLIAQLQFEFENKIRNGVYGLTQCKMSYNSNRIDGSQFTENQTTTLFETRQFGGSDVYNAHDIEEASGHFLMFNYMLSTLDEPLVVPLIKEYHRQLKQCAYEDLLNQYAIGDWKTRINTAGDMKTVPPESINSAISKLISDYFLLSKHTLHDIIVFHFEYERIHPFQSGNGVTGRLLMFRECLTNDIQPFIVPAKDKLLYLQCLRDYDIEKMKQLVKIWQESYAYMVRDLL